MQYTFVGALGVANLLKMVDCCFIWLEGNIKGCHQASKHAFLEQPVQPNSSPPPLPTQQILVCIYTSTNNTHTQAKKNTRTIQLGGSVGLPLLPSLSRATISFPNLSRTMLLSSVAKANAATPFDPGSPGEAAGPVDFPAPMQTVQGRHRDRCIRQLKNASQHESPLDEDLDF